MNFEVAFESGRILRVKIKGKVPTGVEITRKIKGKVDKATYIGPVRK
jgi:hypothetical protein